MTSVDDFDEAKLPNTLFCAFYLVGPMALRFHLSNPELVGVMDQHYSVNPCLFPLRCFAFADLF